MMRDSLLKPLLLCEPRSSRSQFPNLRIHVGEKKKTKGEPLVLISILLAAAGSPGK
jgi:hypothetical protein